MKFYHLLQI